MIRLDIKKVIRYLFSSGTSFGVDLLLFTIFNYLFNSILIATILARVISSLINYFLNSRMVFKAYSKSSIVKYYSLVIIQMFMSAFLVGQFVTIFDGINATIIKFFVDVIIFVVNYFVQKEVVFK